MTTRNLVIGLDGFDPVLAEKWMAAGVLPALKKLKDTGCFAPLKSTIPPFTYPAWSSFLTGANPGKHGIIDFAVRRFGSYKLRFINSTHRRLPTFLKLLSDAGKTVGSMGVPTMYPPEPVRGFTIAGFDSPVAVHADASFCYPPELYHELRKNASPYTLAGIQEMDIHDGWHAMAEKRLVTSIEKRCAIAAYLAKKADYDTLVVVFSESDTASHHFWSFHDPDSPRSPPNRDAFKHVIQKIYKTLDAAVDTLVALHPSANVFIVSDHGFGGTGHRAISINRMLHQGGFLRFKKKTSGWRLSPHGLARHVPPAIQEKLFRMFSSKIPAFFEQRERLSHIALDETVAFSDELNYFSSVWIHDVRFPSGRRMTDSRRNEISRKIIDFLADIEDPATGTRIFRRVYRKEEIYSGDALDAIPDIILVPNLDGNYSYPILRKRTPGPIIEPLPPDLMRGHKGGSMNGSHRQWGVFFAGGPDILHATPAADIALADIAPTLLKLSGFAPPAFMDGRVMEEILSPRARAARRRIGRDRFQAETREYSDAESEELRSRLKDLGYFQ